MIKIRRCWRIQNFELKTTAAIGDPADGGVIACLAGGLNNVVIVQAPNGCPWVSTTGSTREASGYFLSISTYANVVIIKWLLNLFVEYNSTMIQFSI